MEAHTVLGYLRNELKFTASEWGTLTEKDKADLKAWSYDEMIARGISVKDAPKAA